MGPTWGPWGGRQNPGGPHVGPMNFAICSFRLWKLTTNDPHHNLMGCLKVYIVSTFRNIFMKLTVLTVFALYLSQKSLTLSYILDIPRIPVDIHTWIYHVHNFICPRLQKQKQNLKNVYPNKVSLFNSTDLQTYLINHLQWGCNLDGVGR